MSATTPGTDLDLREQIARIDRNQAEIAKFFGEAAKLRAESVKMASEAAKLTSEATKLASEAAKLQRDTRLAPWIVVGGVAGGILTAATLLMRALGILS